MWNSGADFVGGYGGPGDGGFMAPNSQFDSPATKEQTRGRRIQNLVPMTLRSILECGDSGLQVSGMDVHTAVVVGLIRAVDVTSTKITYTLDDTTATMDVVQWIESDIQTEDGRNGSLMEMTYCRAAGSVRSQQGKRHLMAFKIAPIMDLNIITNHLLTVMHSTLKLQNIQALQADGGTGAVAGADAPSMSNSLVGAGALGFGMGTGGGGGGDGFVMQGLTGQQTLVYQAIHQCPDEAGAARQAIYSTLVGKLSHKQIDDVLDFLSSEGHIYSTIDEDHFKSTDG